MEKYIQKQTNNENNIGKVSTEKVQKNKH